MTNIPDILKLEHYFDFKLADYRELFDDCEFAWDAIRKLQDGKFVDAICRARCAAAQVGGASPARITGGVHTRIAKTAQIDPFVVISGEDGGLVSIGDGAEILPGTVISAGRNAISIGNGVTVGPNAHIDASAGSICIGEEASLRQGAFARGLSLISARAVIGNSCEIKCSLIGREAEVPHFNYVGDSLLGFKAHLGAGVKISNLKITPEPGRKGSAAVKQSADGGAAASRTGTQDSSIKVKCGASVFDTGLRKFGAVIGDLVRVGCNSVCNPGTFIGKNTVVYTGSSLAGIVPANSIMKLRQTFERIDIRK